jgi:proteasome lid subunit RPN8/RPN11
MLTLASGVREAMVAHARQGAPEEVVGVLGGERGDRSTATAIERATNAADQPRTNYEIGPPELLELVDGIEERGLDVVGFYHSHPAGPAAPSETDRRQATWVDHSYVIVSLGGETPEVGAWRWTGERFEREEIRRP